MMENERGLGMYNLLVVDDEEIAVKGIIHGIDWSDMPLDRILYAYDVADAMEIIGKEKVHLLLSDIDMPDNNGIGLLKWVRENSPQTETIFLTGYADFSYAQQALHLGSFDYLLKPIDHGDLKATLNKAIAKIQTTEKIAEFQQTYDFYFQQWNKQLPILTERFWQDILNLRIPMTSSHLANAYSLYGIPLEPASPVQLILLSVEQWNEELTARDEEIMTYGLKNAAEEFIIKEGGAGQVIQETGGMLFAVLYQPSASEMDQIIHNCKDFIALCKTYMRCDISCYIGEPVGVPELHGAAQRLTSMERNYLSHGATVITERDYKPETASLGIHPSFEDWAILLEMGKRSELLMRLEESFDRMENNPIDSLFLEGYYHGLVYTVFHVLQKKSVSMNEVYLNNDWRDSTSITKSLQRLRDWAIRFIEHAVDYLSDNTVNVSPFVQKAIQYMNEHLSEDLCREQIASHVYLNPAYLSRLFKKETGQSLTEYIMEARIAKAKPLLEKTNLKVSDIAMTVGYDNFSHFTKMFKKITGFSPVEYRRKYQNVDS